MSPPPAKKFKKLYVIKFSEVSCQVASLCLLTVTLSLVEGINNVTFIRHIMSIYYNKLKCVC